MNSHHRVKIGACLSSGRQKVGGEHFHPSAGRAADSYKERKIIMEIKHYRLHQGLQQDILYTYIKVGKRDFYLKRETWDNIKTFFIILLTTTTVFAIV